MERGAKEEKNTDDTGTLSILLHRVQSGELAVGAALRQLGTLPV